MKVNHNSTVPLHNQAESLLRELLSLPEYQKGKYLPREVDLAEEWGISRSTLRHAIDKLVYEGLLVRKKRVGTQAVKKNVSVGVKNWLSFSQEMHLKGIEIHNYELHVRHQPSSEELAEVFGIKPGDKCLVLERVRGNVLIPFVYFISYFNPATHLTGDENFNRPLYEILEKDYSIIVKHSKEEIAASLAGDKIAEKLELSASDPILIRKRKVYDTTGMLVEYNIGYYRADSFTYSIEADR